MNENPQISARYCGQINQNAHLGSWRLDLGSQLLTCSDEACRVLGLDVGAPIAFERFLQCIHPEDRPSSIGHGMLPCAESPLICGIASSAEGRFAGYTCGQHSRATPLVGPERQTDGRGHHRSQEGRAGAELYAPTARRVGQPRSRYALPIPSSSGRQLALPLCQHENTGNIRGCTGGCC